MSKRNIALGVISIIILISAVGCGQTANFLGNTSENEKETVKSTEIYIPIEKVRTFNPVISKDEDAYYVNKLIYEGLFGYDQNLNLINILAKSYSYAADGSSVTIKLKEGIRWQDGEELTAEDVKFTMDTIAGTSFSGSSLYIVNMNNIRNTKLDSTDPYSITVFFSENRNNSMHNFTFPIIPKHRFKSIEDAKNSDAEFMPVGTGPYRVTDYNQLSHIVLEGYKKYHGGDAPSNKLYFSIIPERNNAVNLMGVNNISLIFSKEMDRDTIYSNKDVNVTNFSSNEAELIGFNFGKSAMSDKNVRQAIAYAIDTKKIIESAYYKNGIQNNTIYYPNFLNVKSPDIEYDVDIAKAKELLTKAGYIDRNGDGLVEDIHNKTISVNILVNEENQSRVAAAQIIKESLDQLPIKTYISNRNWNAYNTDLAAGNFDIYIGGYQFKENYDLRPLLQTGSGNIISYSNTALDALLDKMESGISTEERKATFMQVQNIMIDDLPYYCLLYKTYGAISAPTMKGEIKPVFFNLFQGCEQWYSEYEIPAELPDETTKAEE